jgi:3-hydroxyacyl-CoA dehydrogenase / 3-hydroxy-2-methylbutyryl-CoA dehydrogenase
MQIDKHTFIITGGNSGLGKATVEYLVARKANIVSLDCAEQIGQETHFANKDQVLFIQTDVCDDASITAALAKATKHFGSIQGLINCAGILVAERIIKKDGSLFDLQQFRRCIDVNLLGTFNMIRRSAPLLAKNSANAEGERGVIINTASIAASDGQVGQAAYAAAKAGITGMTLPIARELGSFGIRVMTIAPGIFDTPLFTNINEKKRRALEQQVPFPPRLGNPREFAALAAHIIENPMMNGATIRLDGALRM